MRELADSTRIERFMRELGQAVKVEGRVYFAGGATAVLYGWRETTIDVDLKLIPDRDEILRETRSRHSRHQRDDLQRPRKSS